MTITRFVLAIFALTMVPTTTVLAKAKSDTSTRTGVAVKDDAQVSRTVLKGKNGSVLRQDLFDRMNRNSIRTDWPAPPAQPGQF